MKLTEKLDGIRTLVNYPQYAHIKEEDINNIDHTEAVEALVRLMDYLDYYTTIPDNDIEAIREIIDNES